MQENVQFVLSDYEWAVFSDVSGSQLWDGESILWGAGENGPFGPSLPLVKREWRCHSPKGAAEELWIQCSVSPGGFEEVPTISSIPEAPFSRAVFLPNSTVSICLCVHFTLEITPEKKKITINVRVSCLFILTAQNWNNHTKVLLIKTRLGPLVLAF